VPTETPLSLASCRIDTRSSAISKNGFGGHAA
jgi:hypothetical protein